MTRRKENKIFEVAIKSGCDVDGDLVVYKGALYYVDIKTECVRLSDDNIYNLGWLERRRISGRFPQPITYKKLFFRK